MKKQPRKWWKWLLGGALSASALMLVLYIYIDRRVAQRLEARGSDMIPAIYSDSLQLAPSRAITPTVLREQLLKRRYIELPTKPSQAGEFNFSASGLEVITRKFSGSDGALHPSYHVKVLPTGEIKFITGESNSAAPPNFELEPTIIATFGSGDVRASSYKTLAAIPKSLKDAVLAIEDQRFYQHFGIDLEGLLRAFVENIRAMDFVQGGSTITQQLAKNVVLSPERTLTRKVMEIFAALSLERRLSKDEILERYLNEVYLGQEGSVAIHGVAEAASTFFGKKLDQLSLAEAALLAGIIKGPSVYSPRRHVKRAQQRRDLVLDKMLELNQIDSDQMAQAKRSKILVTRDSKHRRSAPFFMAALKQDLDSRLNVDAATLSGLLVYTGLNNDLQACAEQALSSGLEQLEKEMPSLVRKGPALEAALVSIEPYSGKIRAWVGGRDFSENQFNHVSQAKRQIGSTIKPFLYLTALDPALNSYKVATTTSILSDRPMQLDLITHDIWEPENYDHEYRGDVTLRYALENSLNIPAIYVAERVGIHAVASTVKRFRVASEVPAVPALALGTVDTTLLDLTAAYSAIANAGIYVQPRLYLSIADSGGDIFNSSQITEERVADENPVYVLTNILQGVVERGTGAAVRRLGYYGTAAGKTGTSNDTRDAWFVGFNPALTTGVWVGYDDNSKTGLTGGRAAAPIWTNYMKCAQPLIGDERFVAPPGITFVDVDTQSGKLVTGECAENTVREVFVRGTEPHEYCHPYAREPEFRDRPSEFDRPAEPPRRRRKSFWESIFG